MTPIKDTDYLAVSAWLHAMETRLLTPEKVERLLEAASETEAADGMRLCRSSPTGGSAAGASGNALQRAGGCCAGSKAH